MVFQNDLNLAWTAAERAAWAPPEDITVSQWAEKHRVLPKQSARPGLWNNRLAPYTVGVMDAFNDPRVERITIMASVQSAKTESAYNMLGYAVSQDPAPALVVMPTDKTLKRVNKRLQDMITESPELSRYLTGNQDDMQKRLIVLKRMEIHFATAGSKSDLANVEARYILLDEPDRYPLEDDEEGSPIERAEARATTYWNRKIIETCTPTIPEGHINVEFQRSDQRRYWVPCPYCGGYQVLIFRQVKHQGEKLMEWPPHLRDPEYIKRERVARYECLYCLAEIDDADKAGMLARGKWVSEGHAIERDGRMEPLPPTSHVGFTWNALYSPFRNFSEVAAQFFASKGDREKMKTFVNLWLAEPWKEIIKPREASAILELKTNRPELVVPDGALALTAGIDNQKRGLWCSIWAWVRLKSGLIDQHLIRYGFLADFVQLEVWLFQDVYSTADGQMTYPVWRGGIDTGGGEGEAGDPGMTEQVYQWLRLHGRGRIFGVKGHARALAGGKKMQESRIDKFPGGRPIPGGLCLYLLDTNALKDAFWSRVETGRVHLHSGTDELFAAHLSAEAKERNRQGKLLWMQQGKKPNHLLDTAIYATAMADPECGGGVMVLPQPGLRERADREEVNPVTGKPVGTWFK
jgi:phage terminase large subunit GpA-like protein